MTRSNLATKAAEITYDDAWRVICADIEELAKSGDITEDDLSDVIHESCDGHQRVIYTHQARVGLCCTDNPEAYEEELGEKPLTVEAAMCMAMIADVTVRLGDIEWPEESDG